VPKVPGSDSKYLVTAGWDSVPHLDEKTKKELLDATPSHLRDARSKGVPAMGSGRIFPVDEALIKIAPFALPAHWPRLVGMDFGWDHPSAFVWFAWDRDTDTVYIYDALRMSETLIPVQAAAVKGRGEWIPVSWPHDGYQVRDAMHGEQLAQQYRAQGVNMRPEHAAFPESPIVGERKESRISTEAGIQEMLTRMMGGRLKVFSHLNEWFEEFRMYHREKGLIVKLRDDLLSASRIGIMDLRFAITEPRADKGVDYGARADWF
jgi:hypothetical protein